MHGDEAVRTWRAEVGGGAICMHGTTSAYEVDPAGEYIVGMVLAGGMEVRRDGEVHRFGPGDVCAWDPTARHSGRPWRSAGWEARLIVLELPGLQDVLRDPEVAGGDVAFASPRVRDQRLARGFVELHAALEAPAWRLERDTLLQEWLCALAGGAPVAASRAARRDPALRRACELLSEDLARNLALAERRRGGRREPPPADAAVQGGLRPAPASLRARPARPRGAAAARARRHSRRGRAAQTGFFDQSHLHRHFTRTLGMTPGAYAAAMRSDVQDARAGSA